MSQATTQTLTDQQVAAYHRDGYVVIRGMFSKAELDELRETFMKQSELGPVKDLWNPTNDNPKDPLARYPRMMHPHRQSQLPIGPLSMRIGLDPRVGAVLADLFGEEAVCAQTMFYFKPAGSRGQSLHQDNFYLRVSPGTCMAAWLAVDDADSENGGLVCVPGSHNLKIACPEKADASRFFTNDHVPVPEGLREEPINLKAGDVLFFNGSVIHGSYENTSKDRFRRAFISHYVPASSKEVSQWYRPLYRFDGNEVAMNGATGGGPCGGEEAKGPH
jgi:ectoine hydroxylase-related dioxygenase (phytanoyl-CoA dioxygenase family)